MLTCNECKHLIGNREHTEDWNDWKCGHPKNILEQKINLVSGDEYTIYGIELCKDQRNALGIGNNLCGQNGDWYEEYMPPVRTSNTEPTIGGTKATEIIFSEETLAANREAATKAIAERKARKLSEQDLKNL